MSNHFYRKDILSRDLNIGDKVVFTYAHSNELYLCTIERFTPCTIILYNSPHCSMVCKDPMASILKLADKDGNKNEYHPFQ